MKDYVIKISDNITKVINIKESNTVYEFCDSSKDIIDNLNKGKEYTLKLLREKYTDIDSNVIEKDYYNFVDELNELNININNIEDIMIILEENKINNATIEIINKCPFKCKHCYIDDRQIEIGLEKYKSIVDELAEINCKEILLTGGEPMLHKNFIEIYLYAKKKGMLVNINSTLFLLNEEILSILSEYKPNVVEVSIYGYDDDSYKKFTGVNHAFNIVDNNINKLVDNDININLKSVMTKSNCKNIIKIKEYANNKKLPFRFDYVVFPSLNRIKKNEERCSPTEIINVIKNDNEAKYFFKEKINNLKIVNDNEKVFQCGICSGRIFISSNLDIRPCLVVPFKVNLVDYNIKDAYKIITNKPKNLIMSNNNKCKDCNKKSICRYCPGKFYMETGNFEIAPNFYCRLADLIIEELK